ncbi:MAG TPA: hypothetical protein VMJ32_11885 [Pirellulales bacterium]|nr:hypothetical protein [Pirellulales bacterium]
MSNERDVEILALIDRLRNEIDLAEKHSLDVTVRLLRTAVLDLHTLVFSISDDELRSISDALEDASLSEGKSADRYQ